MSEERKKRADAGEGWVFKRGNVWWIGYHHNFDEKRESAGRTEEEARKKLKRRLKEMAAEQYVGPKQERLTVAELLNELLEHLETKGAPSARTFTSHALPLREFFGTMRALTVTAAHVERYTRERLADEKAPKTVNNEISTLRQAFNLARKRNRLARVPYLPLLKISNARQGFFEESEFANVVAHLPEPINDIARFGYLTGWRKGEILPLRWDAVDRTAGEIRLATSKNGHGRVLALDEELAALIERRWEARNVPGIDGTTRISEFVFHHSGRFGGTPRPYVNIDVSWKDACKKAGVPDKLFHDFRRTAVRNMVRAGVPETVAMKISGHRTRSMFDRYNITSGEDVREALRRTHAHRKDTAAPSNVVSFPIKDAK